jgi:hypothetical protein
MRRLSEGCTALGLRFSVDRSLGVVESFLSASARGGDCSAVDSAASFPRRSSIEL